MRIRQLAFAICGLFAITAARADIIFIADITHVAEVSPTNLAPLLTSTGAPRLLSFGTAIFDLNDAMTALTMDATIFNIDVTGTQTPDDTNDNLGNAHIHANATATITSAAAPVVWGFFGTPFNDTLPMDIVVTPFTTGVGGRFTSVWNAPEGNNTTLTAQLPNILGGHAYINFHTVQFGGGEIRGFLQAVPEPGTFALVAMGLASLLLGARKKAE